MRKISILLMCVMVLVLSACNDKSKSSSNDKNGEEIESDQVSFLKEEPKWDIQYGVDEEYNFNGLNVLLEDINFSTYEDTPQIGIKIKYENRGHGSFEVYPGQASIKLDSGEELSVTDVSFTKEEGSSKISDKGDTFTATYAWNLSYSDIPEIKKVEISWDDYQVSGDDILDYKKFNGVYELED
ncbi:hypothetical protein P9D51_10910 [Bacillus sonorensis]|uniref:hypothetical protein n=1 Tax=Bacillus sonorensis TaxID=119858 RepID=UPI002DC03C83|nr:hypothetical protein [Bacillus sonorensis]MEC1426614.1 hypothetical protein [Bacillus sonorensis]